MYTYLTTEGKIDTINIAISAIKSWIFAVILSPIIYTIGRLLNILDRLILSEKDFIIILLISVIVDTTIGLIKHIKIKDLCVRKFILKTFEKLSLCMIGMVLFNSLSYPIRNHSDMLEWFNIMVQLVLLTYPIMNAFKNIYILSTGKFPPKFIMDRFLKFNETGNVNEIFNSKSDKINENKVNENIQE
jgi:hypothetical protein